MLSRCQFSGLWLMWQTVVTTLKYRDRTDWLGDIDVNHNGTTFGGGTRSGGSIHSDSLDQPVSQGQFSYGIWPGIFVVVRESSCAGGCSLLALFAVLVARLLYIYLGQGTAVSNVIGAVCSAAAGYIGMQAVTRAHLCTVHAANRFGEGPAPG